MTNTPSQSTGLIDMLSRQRKQSTYVLFIAAAAFALLTYWLSKAQPDGYMPLCLGGALFALVNLCLGMYQQLRDPARYPEPEATRLFVLGLAGLNGLVLAIAGAALAIHWWDKYVDWLRGEPGPDVWKVYASLFAVFGGLAIMFVGLQAGRGQEHTDPIWRRLLYGYNTLLAAILLLAILVVLNGLAYARFSVPIDFTATSVYTLSSRSRSILEGLQKPTKIYVIMMPHARLEVQTLLDNCRAINNKIQVEYLDPRPTGDIERIHELSTKYSFTARAGILIVYGADADAAHRFITLDDLYENDTMRTREVKFKGEDELMTALSSLAEGKTKPVVYFTQGHGELDIADMDEANMNRGLAVLKSRLEKRNYDVKVLNFSAGEPKVPDDAAIVAIVGAKNPFQPQEIQALRQYANPGRPGAKKGKLVVFMGWSQTPEGTMQQTGIEPLIHEFKIDVGNELVFNLTVKNPRLNLGVINPRLFDRNPIATTFSNVELRFYDVRPVKVSMGPAAGNTFSADPLIFIPRSLAIWAEPNLRANPSELAEQLFKNADLRDKKLSQDHISVAAVAVSPPDMSDPHMLSRQSSEGTPRIAVFGTSSIASNYFTSERRSSMEYELVANTFDWLREKPQSIGIEPKNRDLFTLSSTISTARLVFLPALLMLLAIVALGTSIWLIRRQ
jgi:hypothetical protein